MPRPLPVRQPLSSVGWVLLAALSAVAGGLAGARLAQPRAHPPLAGDLKPDRSAAPQDADLETGRGRHADGPRRMPPRGWRDIVLRTVKEFSDDNIPMIAAGMTFYTLLAVFPAIAAFVALWGLFADVGEAREQITALGVVLPADLVRTVGDEMIRVAAAHPSKLSVTFVTGLGLTLWSANGAVKACFLGLNIAYEEVEKRRFRRKTLTSLGFTTAGLGLAAAGLVLLLTPPFVAAHAGPAAGGLAELVVWAVLALGVGVAIAALYRYGPSRGRARWRWVSWGAALATVGWAAVSVGYSFYVGHFAHYDRTYGSFGAVVGLMMWTYLSCLVLLLGAELNAELEHQTLEDTTTGPPAPLGQRGARMADTVGQAQ